MCTASPIINTTHQSATFATIDDPMAIVYIKVVRSVSLDKCIMVCVHHYCIIQSIFTALKILCAPRIHLPFQIQLGVFFFWWWHSSPLLICFETSIATQSWEANPFHILCVVSAVIK